MHTAPRKLLLLATLFAAAATAADSPRPMPLPSREERLSHLARLWGHVRYLHPASLYKDIDWDGALVAAIPRVEAAKSVDSYAAAMQGLLDVLGDPATRVQRPGEQLEEQDGPPSTARAVRSWEGKEVLVWDLRALRTHSDLMTLGRQREELRAELSQASAVLVDLRARGLRHTSWLMSEAFSSLLPLLLNQELVVPGGRSVTHWGYRSQSGMSSGYSSSLDVEAGEVVAPRGDGRQRRVILLVDEASYLSVGMLALQAQGLAQLVSEGRLSEGAMGARTRVELGAGLTALVRLGDFGLPVRADVELPRRSAKDSQDKALQAALAQTRKPAPRQAKARAAEPPPQGRWRPDRRYEDMLYPSREYRLLALFRMWNVIESFFPYKPLMDRDWDEALAAYLPRFEAASSAEQYALAVAELSTLLQDSHVAVRGHPELLKRGLGATPAPLTLMEVEGKAVVVKVADPELAPGLAVGQVVETFNGKPLEDCVRELYPYVAGSNEVHRRYRTLVSVLSGEPGSQGVLGVREASGALKEVRFTRAALGGQKPPAGEPYRLLEGNIGYVDLRLLQAHEVAPMFEKLKDTRAIVFDLRGYPNGTFWTIAPYLNTREARHAALFERCLVSLSLGCSTRMRSSQEMPKESVPLYRGRTVTLIDERAISQAEHTGLFFEAANGTTFVGSPTAGANGDVTDLVLPGGITVYFTGHDVRHADGRQLQRLGLQPHVFMRPTIAGLQAGRDEVLEQALELLKSASSSQP